MSGRKHHYQEAERLLDLAADLAYFIAELTDKNLPTSDAFKIHQATLAAAHVHAILATAELFVAGS